MYIKKFIFISSSPFLLACDPGLEYITVPVVVLVSYILLSVELIAEEIEDPFASGM